MISLSLQVFMTENDICKHTQKKTPRHPHKTIKMYSRINATLAGIFINRGYYYLALLRTRCVCTPFGKPKLILSMLLFSKSGDNGLNPLPFL